VTTAVAQMSGNKVAATTHCTTASVKGDFAFAGQGFLARAPLAFVGVLHFDGKGRFSTGLPPHDHTIVFTVHGGGNEGYFLGIDNSPPGQFHEGDPRARHRVLRHLEAALSGSCRPLPSGAIMAGGESTRRRR
jgi:hypothetical protein